MTETGFSAGSLSVTRGLAGRIGAGLVAMRALTPFDGVHLILSAAAAGWTGALIRANGLRGAMIPIVLAIAAGALAFGLALASRGLAAEAHRFSQGEVRTEGFLRRGGRLALRAHLARGAAGLALGACLAAFVALAFPGRAWTPPVLAALLAAILLRSGGLARLGRDRDWLIEALVPDPAIAGIQHRDRAAERFHAGWTSAGRLVAARRALALHPAVAPAVREVALAQYAPGMVRVVVQPVRKTLRGEMALLGSGWQWAAACAGLAAVLAFALTLLVPLERMPQLPPLSAFASPPPPQAAGAEGNGDGAAANDQPGEPEPDGAGGNETEGASPGADETPAESGADTAGDGPEGSEAAGDGQGSGGTGNQAGSSPDASGEGDVGAETGGGDEQGSGSTDQSPNAPEQPGSEGGAEGDAPHQGADARAVPGDPGGADAGQPGTDTGGQDTSGEDAGDPAQSGQPVETAEPNPGDATNADAPGTGSDTGVGPAAEAQEPGSAVPADQPGEVVENADQNPPAEDTDPASGEDGGAPGISDADSPSAGADAQTPQPGMGSDIDAESAAAAQEPGAPEPSSDPDDQRGDAGEGGGQDSRAEEADGNADPATAPTRADESNDPGGSDAQSPAPESVAQAPTPPDASSDTSSDPPSDAQADEGTEGPASGDLGPVLPEVTGDTPQGASTEADGGMVIGPASGAEPAGPPIDIDGPLPPGRYEILGPAPGDADGPVLASDLSLPPDTGIVGTAAAPGRGTGGEEFALPLSLAPGSEERGDLVAGTLTRLFAEPGEVPATVEARIPPPETAAPAAVDPQPARQLVPAWINELVP